MEDNRKSPVWDLPLRLVHWLLVILVAFSWYTMEVSEALDAQTWHEWSGYGILFLLVFRLIWGVIGGRHARFSDFVRGPGAVVSYVRNIRGGGGKAYRGHNPLGALSVIALVGLLGLQVVTGLFANDDILYEGPLFHLVDKETSDFLTGIHHQSWEVLQILIVLHLAAIAVYLFILKKNLVRPMITGQGNGPTEEGQVPVQGRVSAALVALALSAIAVWTVISYL